MSVTARRLVRLLGLTLLALACTLGPALTPASTPTATLLPTHTSAPPATPTLLVDLITETPVPSAIVDPESPDAWACKLRSQVPKDGTKVDPKERFDVAWQVENFGYAVWEPDRIRVTYYSGTPMQVNDSIQLKQSIATDEWTQFVVPMVAPRGSGGYTTVWALWYGDRDFCHLRVSITVR